MLATLVMNILPWAFGASVLYLLIKPTEFEIKAARHCTLIGGGLYVGYLCLAMLLEIALAFGLPLLSVIFILAIPTVVSICKLFIRANWLIQSEHTQADGIFKLRPAYLNNVTSSPLKLFLYTFFALWLGVITCFLLHEAFHSPTMGWDAVINWSPLATALLADLDLGSASLAGSSLHPETKILTMSWSAYWTNYFETSSFLYLPWLLIFFAGLLVLVGLIYEITRNTNLSLVTAVALMASPVTEAHIVMGGYADIWVHLGIITSIGLISNWRPSTNKQARLLVGLAVAASVALLKNDAPVQSVIILLSFAIAGINAFMKRGAMLVVCILLATVTLCVAIATFGIDISILSYTIKYMPSENFIQLGARTSNINDAELARILWNFWTSIGINASFATSTVLAICMIPAVVCYSIYKKFFSVTLISMIAFLELLFLASAQHLSEYFYRYSIPQGDTGLTRFSQPLTFTALISIMLLLAVIFNTKYRQI